MLLLRMLGILLVLTILGIIWPRNRYEWLFPLSVVGVYVLARL